MSTSSIEWTEVTWNPVTGCTKISAGCKFCYAERMAKRLQAMGVEQYSDGFKVRLAPKMLDLPRQWRKPKVVFVNSMSDLFQEEVPLEYIQQVFKVMNETPHIYQVLTKRADRLRAIAPYLTWTKNIWMGVSVEDERVAHRIPDLLATPAQVRFLSLEPLIGPINTLPLDGIDWVIVGGESGPGARPVKKEWITSIKARVDAKKIAFFFKQWGKTAFNPNPFDPTISASDPHHAKGGCHLDDQRFQFLPMLHEGRNASDNLPTLNKGRSALNPPVGTHLGNP
jgi:protein gp37